LNGLFPLPCLFQTQPKTCYEKETDAAIYRGRCTAIAGADATAGTSTITGARAVTGAATIAGAATVTRAATNAGVDATPAVVVALRKMFPATCRIPPVLVTPVVVRHVTGTRVFDPENVAACAVVIAGRQALLG
jgi:hypothetical protein